MTMLQGSYSQEGLDPQTQRCYLPELAKGLLLLLVQ
jgi:hypothetical protein